LKASLGVPDRSWAINTFHDVVRGDMSAKAYYEGALTALRFVERRLPTSRRFGTEADARWASFRGDLTTADRIDLLLRDADAEWPSAFGARVVHALRAVAEDEPFGSAWTSIDPVDAEELWRGLTQKPVNDDVRATLLTIAAAWELKVPSFDAGAITAVDKLVIAGPAAIVAVVEAFARGVALDWADQVVVVATPPAHRQLAAVAAALLNARRPTVLLEAASPPMSRLPARLVVSPDAEAADAARAAAIAAGTAA
jgi:hypothetical protein